MGKNRTTSYQPSEGRTGRPRKLVVDGKQQCSTCGNWKMLEEFYKAKHTFNGRESRCIACDRERTRDYHNDDLKRALTRILKMHLNVKAGKRSKRRVELCVGSCVTIEMLMDLWDRQGGKCAVTEVPMTHIHGKGPLLTNVSIDRIDNSFGYIPDNVRLVCRAVNAMKYVMSDSEMIQWAALILNGPLANKPR